MCTTFQIAMTKHELEELLLALYIFLSYIRYNPEYLTQNKNRLAIQIHHSTLEFIVVVLLSYIFPLVIYQQVFKSNMFICIS